MAVFTRTAQISNTTSAAGIYTARFTATDDHGRTAYVDVPVTLLEPLTIETPYSLAAYRNVPYTFTLTSNAANVVYISDDPNITINGDQATLLCNTIRDTYSVTFTVTDSYGRTASKTIQAQVASDVLTLSASPGGLGIVNRPYKIKLEAYSPYLPISITCSDSNVVIPDISTSGEANINYTLTMNQAVTLTFTATDAQGQTATAATTYIPAEMTITPTIDYVGLAGPGYPVTVTMIAANAASGETVNYSVEQVPVGVSVVIDDDEITFEEISEHDGSTYTVTIIGETNSGQTAMCQITIGTYTSIHI